jgi:hypothetical protein
LRGKFEVNDADSVVVNSEKRRAYWFKGRLANHVFYHTNYLIFLLFCTISPMGFLNPMSCKAASLIIIADESVEKSLENRVPVSLPTYRFAVIMRDLVGHKKRLRIRRFAFPVYVGCPTVLVRNLTPDSENPATAQS